MRDLEVAFLARGLDRNVARAILRAEPLELVLVGVLKSILRGDLVRGGLLLLHACQLKTPLELCCASG